MAASEVEDCNRREGAALAGYRFDRPGLGNQQADFRSATTHLVQFDDTVTMSPTERRAAASPIWLAEMVSPA